MVAVLSSAAADEEEHVSPLRKAGASRKARGRISAGLRVAAEGRCWVVMAAVVG